MKAGWPVKPVGELCDIIGGGTPSKSNTAFFSGSIPWATVRDMKADWIEATEHSITPEAVKQSATHILPSGTVVIASRVGLVKICRIVKDTAINQDLRGFIPKAKVQLDIQYLFWWFKSVAGQIVAAGNGATVQGVTLPFLRSLEIPLPPFDEQRRIVAVLDKAFAGIATATANAQDNLTKARALFDSYLQAAFTNPGSEWIVEPITKNVRFIDYRGKTPPKRDKGVRLITAKNVKMGYVRRTPEEFIDPDAYDGWMTRGFPKRGDVLFTTEAPLGNVAQLDTDEKVVIGQRLITMQPEPQRIDSEFLKYMLCSAPLQNAIRTHATGATVSGIKAKLLKTIPIFYPKTIDAQLEIVEKLDEIYNRAERLAELQKSKLATLTELRHSLLQKAFTGELTAIIAVPAAPATSDTFLSPQFTAQVIAFAHRRHEQQGSQKTFGRVKAQKALHLVESIGEIELGRQPMKDAAGPNDMQHMLRATDWAVRQGFFAFGPRASGNGYDFRKLANYDALWAEAVVATRPVAAVLERAIDPIVPMVSLEAELFATVHAAWNNLIHDRATTTDDAIVKEARENWHSSKLAIPEQKFRSTIKLIRSKGLEPDGSAKYVGGQAKLI